MRASFLFTLIACQHRSKALLPAKLSVLRPNIFRNMASFSSSESSLTRSQQNSYETTSIDRVVSCTSSGASTADEKYWVVLDNSVLYPEGGGQPSDFGTVAGLPVHAVERSDGTSIRVLLDAALDVGSAVESKIDWTRRFDHMQQHTCQHLLSAIAHKHFALNTVGWSLGSESVTVDLQNAGDTPVTSAEVQAIEALVNEEIRQGKQVWWSLHSRAQLDSLESTPSSSSSLPADPALAPLTHIRGVPKGAAAEFSELRMVCIAGLDANPCGGTHVRALSELQFMKCLGTEKDRTATRLRFVCGNRALKMVESSWLREQALSPLLSVPPSAFIGAVEKLVTERRDNEKKMKIYLSELARFLGQSIASSIAASHGAVAAADDASLSAGGGGEFRVHMVHRYGADLAFLLSLADAVTSDDAWKALPAAVVSKQFVFLSGDDLSPALNSAAAPVTAAGGSTKKDKGAKKAVTATATAADSAAPSSSGDVAGPFVLIGPSDAVTAVKDLVCAAVGGRGGGRPGRLQGQASTVNANTLASVRGILATYTSTSSK